MIAYKVTNLLNGKIYIGITKCGSERKRWNNHVSLALHRQSRGKAVYLLHRAILRYGPESFSVEHIASAKSWEDLCEVERRLIKQEGSFYTEWKGYNMTEGGDGNLGGGAKISAALMGHVHSEETKRKIGQRAAGRKATGDLMLRKREIARAMGKAALDQKAREKRRETLRGRPKSAEHKEKLRASAIAKHALGPYRPMPEQTRIAIGAAVRISNATRGITEETRQKLRESRKGKKRSPETVEKVRNALRGRKLSDETKEKIRARAIGRKMSPEQLAKLAEARKVRRPMSDEAREQRNAKLRGRKRSPEQIAKAVAGKLAAAAAKKSRLATEEANAAS